MKQHSTFLKAPRLEPHHRMQVSVMPGHSFGEEVGLSSSAEMQLAYSTAPAD